MRRFEERDEPRSPSPDKNNKTERMTRRLPLDKAPLAVSVACDSRFVLVGSRGGIVARYDKDSLTDSAALERKKPDAIYKAQTNNSNSVEVVCNPHIAHSRLFATAVSASLQIWDANRSEVPERILNEAHRVLALSWDAVQGNTLAYGTSDHSLNFLDTRVRKPQHTNAGNNINSLSWARNSPFFVSSHDTCVRLWDFRHSAHPVQTIAYHEQVLSAAMETEYLLVGLPSRFILYNSRSQEESQTCNIFQETPEAEFCSFRSEIKLGHVSSARARFFPFGPAFITQTPLSGSYGNESSSLKIYSFHSSSSVELLRQMELPTPTSPGFEFLKLNSMNQEYRLVTSSDKSLEFVPLPRDVVRFIVKKASVLGNRRETKSQIAEEIKQAEHQFPLEAVVKNFSLGVYRFIIHGADGVEIPLTIHFPDEYPAATLKLRDISALPLLLHSSQESLKHEIQTAFAQAAKESAEKSKLALIACFRAILAPLFPEGIPQHPQAMSQQSLRKTPKVKAGMSVFAPWPRSLAFSSNFKGEIIAAWRKPFSRPQQLYLTSLHQLDHQGGDSLPQKENQEDSADHTFEDELGNKFVNPSLADSMSEDKESQNLSENLFEMKRIRDEFHSYTDQDDSLSDSYSERSKRSEKELPSIMSSSELNKTTSELRGVIPLLHKAQSSIQIFPSEIPFTRTTLQLQRHLHISLTLSIVENFEKLYQMQPTSPLWKLCFSRALLLRKSGDSLSSRLASASFFKKSLSLLETEELLFEYVQLAVLLCAADCQALDIPSQTTPLRTEKEEAKRTVSPSPTHEEYYLTQESQHYENLWKKSTGTPYTSKTNTHLSTTTFGKPRAPTLGAHDLQPNQLYRDKKPSLAYTFTPAQNEEAWKGRGEVLLVKDKLTQSDQETIWKMLRALLLSRQILTRREAFMKVRVLEKLVVKISELIFQKGRDSLENWLRVTLRKLLPL